MRQQMVEPENTHRRGKDLCTAGLKFNKIWFNQKRKCVFISIYVVNQLSPNL